MAGSCHAVLIAEAEMKSGTLITSRLATEYNREVLTIPGSIFSPHSDGPHMLLRLGATLVRSAEDIIESLKLNELELIPKKKNSKNNALRYSDCSEKEMLIIGLLAEPLERDEILRSAISLHHLPIHETQTLLSLLELKGLIAESLGEIRLV